MLCCPENLLSFFWVDSTESNFSLIHAHWSWIEYYMIQCLRSYTWFSEYIFGKGGRFKELSSSLPSTQDSSLVPNITLWLTRLNLDATTSHHLLNPIYMIHTLPYCDMLPLLLQYSWSLPVPLLFSKMLTTLSSVFCLARNISWKAGSDCRVTK